MGQNYNKIIHNSLKNTAIHKTAPIIHKIGNLSHEMK